VRECGPEEALVEALVRAENVRARESAAQRRQRRERPSNQPVHAISLFPRRPCLALHALAHATRAFYHDLRDEFGRSSRKLRAVQSKAAVSRLSALESEQEQWRMVIRLHELELDRDQLGACQFAGLRMSVEEFLDLPDDGCKYEMIDGVVTMSPSPVPSHQRVAGEIFAQIKWFLRSHPVGEAFTELDVHLNAGRGGGDLVYSPDVIFVRRERLADMRERIVGAPDLVVEIISRGSRKRDTITKRGDYERFGVGEYWYFDPARETMTFLRLSGGAFVEITPVVDAFTSLAVPGFVLDLKPARQAFKPW
jgi:Uma2 family endonuclease